MPLALTESPETGKENRTYKEIQELLLLHRRYEKKALRLFRKGLPADTSKDVTKRPRASLTPKNDNTLNKSSAERQEKQRSYSQQRKDLTTQLHLNDKEYLRQLVVKEAKVSSVDNSLAPKRDNTHSRTQLRLPKLEGIPPENKEIFYTTLPKMPPLPKLKEKKLAATKSHGKKKRKHKTYSNETGTFTTSSAETCLNIRQLPGDHFMLRDVRNGGAVNTSSSMIKVPKFLGSEEELSSKSLDTEEGYVWIVPVVNIEIPPYRLENWKEIDSRGLPIKKHKDLQRLTATPRGSKIKEDENSEPRYKRNVHFSEFLHEIHLYSPVSSSQSARSNEGLS